LAGLLAGCGFTPGVVGDAGATHDGDGHASACAAPAWSLPYAHRYPITTTAPAGYTLTLDVTEPLTRALPSGDDLRVLADDTELDRVLAASDLDFKVTAASALWLYVGDPAAGAPLRDPANVYLAAESFDELPLGDHASARFDPQPDTEWNVVDDGGNRVYRAAGAGRHPAAVRNLTMANGDIRARMRINTGGGQQHDGLAARGNSMIPATMDGFVGQLMGDSAYHRLAEYTDGASPPVELTGGAYTVTRDIWYAVRLRYVGDDLELDVDGALALSATKTGADGELVGLFAHDCTADFDDVTVRMAASPEPTVQLGTREDRCP
jgi:hypothetical protein